MQRFNLIFFFSFFCFSIFAQGNRVDAFIRTYVNEHHFSGTILIEQRRKTSLHKSFGLANIPFSVRATNNTVYKIASVTKLFTAVLVMQLREEGKLDLQLPFGHYLPDYPGAGKEKVTIHQLLNHTSGLINPDTVTSIESALANNLPVYQRHMTSEQLLRDYCSSESLVSEPGKKFRYNNADYIVLGKIIENITGKSYEDVLAERILRPLNLKHTGLLNQQTIVSGLADSYMYRDDIKRLVNDLLVYYENWYAAGGLYSTSSDLLRFANALFSGKFLTKESLSLITTPGLDEYGYGVWSTSWALGDKKHQVLFRPGLIMGTRAMLVHDLDGEFTIIILSNTGTTNLDDFVFQIAKNLFAGPKKPHIKK